MITSVIRNLISNAVKFTNRGGTISVVAQSTHESAVIWIKDTGIGIPENKIPHLFHPDENHSDLGTEGEKGTGLGLVICKDFVEKNYGKIWVESEPVKGSVVYFSLPAQNHA